LCVKALQFLPTVTVDFIGSTHRTLKLEDY
jgi:hypothetical protein